MTGQGAARAACGALDERWRGVAIVTPIFADAYSVAEAMPRGLGRQMRMRCPANPFHAIEGVRIQ